MAESVWIRQRLQSGGRRTLGKEIRPEIQKTRDMDIGLKYETIKSGKVDVMNIFTTDRQLNGANLTERRYTRPGRQS